MNSAANKARYIMIGGFLGAGKTTAIIRLAQHLTDRGLRVGLISNDQSVGLVDTQMMRQRGFAVEEIPGGCFCCKFNSLVEAANRLSAADTPEIFLAEPVGSCTDLTASVSYPLRRIYGKNYVIAPLSVMVDPIRARRVLGLDPGRHFSSKVVYVYRKQLEEAEIIVINKSDLLDLQQLEELESALRREFSPHAIISCSARLEVGLEEWFELLESSEAWSRNAMDLDYQQYAEGEALLGWLNATVNIASEREFDGNRLITQLARAIQEHLNAREIEVAHLKMTLTPNEGIGEIAAVNLVRNDFVPELSERLEDFILSGTLIINLRAEGESEILKNAAQTAMQSIQEAQETSGLTLHLDHLEHFQPAEPKPTHRMKTAVE